jgi:hypothetical protein
MAVIAVLVSVGLPWLLRFGRDERAFRVRQRAVTDIKVLQERLEEFRAARGRYPTNATSHPVADITVNIAFGELFALTNSDRKIAIIDPWDVPYQYGCTSPMSYRLFSLGPNSKEPMDDVDVNRDQG